MNEISWKWLGDLLVRLQTSNYELNLRTNSQRRCLTCFYTTGLFSAWIWSVDERSKVCNHFQGTVQAWDETLKKLPQHTRASEDNKNLTTPWNTTSERTIFRKALRRFNTSSARYFLIIPLCIINYSLQIIPRVFMAPLSIKTQLSAMCLRPDPLETLPCMFLDIILDISPHSLTCAPVVIIVKSAVYNKLSILVASF